MNPFAAMLDLQAVDAVLVEEREKAVVGVGRKTHGQLRLRTGRVEVDRTDLEACVEVQGVVHVALVEFQALPHASEQFHTHNPRASRVLPQYLPVSVCVYATESNL